MGLVCGGPSSERGISLNSARSALDHLQDCGVVVHPYYVDVGLNVYRISRAQMYCNTPSDFDFKLQNGAERFESHHAFAEDLRRRVDIVFPALHGVWGEDGGIQSLLEAAGLPFVGTGAASAESAFDKISSSQCMKDLGYPVLESKGCCSTTVQTQEVADWMSNMNMDPSVGKLVVKPARAGSSVGVSVVYGAGEAAIACKELSDRGICEHALIEVYAEEGVEFTAIVLEGSNGPVALIPTEVELVNSLVGDSASLEEDLIFNYRRKYLPSQQVKYHTPPRASLGIVQAIRRGAVSLFEELRLKDFARIDGWILPQGFDGVNKPCTEKHYLSTSDRIITFTDINLMSGMEQTSFLFQQAAEAGLSHADVLQQILVNACKRHELELPMQLTESANEAKSGVKQKVHVIFGGNTSERQVSLMSGTNIWLKLCSYKDLQVTPFLLASSLAPGEDVEGYPVLELPYASVLRHTVEEVIETCHKSISLDGQDKLQTLREMVVRDCHTSRIASAGHLWRPSSYPAPPKQMSVLDFARNAKADGAVVFIAIHGGAGENGDLQRLFEKEGVLYTGSSSLTSALCMDKARTGECVEGLRNHGIYTAPKRVLSLEEISLHGNGTIHHNFEKLTEDLGSSEICVKPGSDGCSTGVARLVCKEDLAKYVTAVKQSWSQIPPNTLECSHGIIEMPDPAPSSLLFEPFITSKRVVVQRSQTDGREQLVCIGDSPWIEVTVGVSGVKGRMRAFNPSITVAESAVLSLEEKFQGGTGINLTPPPPEIAAPEAVLQARKRIELVANELGIDGFARIDAFMHVDTGELIIIEANTVPGMTPSTVLFHQALEEQPPIFPREFFRSVVDNALAKA